MMFRKKSVVVNAEQWFPGREIAGVIEVPYTDGDMRFPAKVKTLEGYHGVEAGDWIITGIAGEKYPCKPDIFEQTYELV